MADERAGPGPTLEARDHRGDKTGEEVVPRQAATVVVLRGGAETLEVLLVRRTHAARFMAGVWVFPGGAVDAHEGEGDAAHRQAAVRELEEEAAVGGIAPGDLVEFSRWITPRDVSVRFDTHFFLAIAPAGLEPAVDGDECIDLRWFTPTEALAAHARGELPLAFPTVKHLEQFGAFTSADALMQHAQGREVLAMLPRVVIEGEVARILLPGEQGLRARGMTRE